MKTRIIKTRYWVDSTVHSLSKNSRYLFLYLLTSPHINLCGIFELPDEYICIDTGLNAKEVQKAKEELIACGKAIFRLSWVYIKNADKHNGYRNSPSNEIAYTRELKSIPAEIKLYFDSSVDSTVAPVPTVTINKKQEIRNKKRDRDSLKEKEVIDELKNKFPNADVPKEIEKMNDWLDANGKTKKDYVAFARVWLGRNESERSKPIVRKFTTKGEVFKR